MSPFLPPLAAVLDDYLARHPEEFEVVADFDVFLASHAAVFERSHAVGHFTGSAWLVSADGERVLLMHHRKLDRWLQPGGHADGDADLARVALREAHEETGVAGLRVEGGVFDLDRHRIAARANEPGHWHYDVRYVVRAGADERFTINQESRALLWRAVTDVADDDGLDPSLRRMARKWLGRLV
ncbi:MULTISPECIES: NUDIX hydrolase [Rhodanobacter]|uniref:NUDIX hydrolase n=1 Tax=Rhodanobacter TaxID=75309 RepID=UPI000485012A|nr:MULTISPECIES: NUDIX hydrolase [Rhodanobacter]KZC21036.1 NUDIX hydrolase [Rhodanobacter denitrificans]UJJ52419.1 NUDIX hydrolase [Rhodanobacter denitrificans]UJM89266.1 NUDIX hydrolase [Rhodanobacter denitrificans]UJM95172.1 NUDIX hydrolase [Rhodanobacter denitrificans]UJM98703.1 NUDIX hydrolase [Rhodanobacter denitrificans]